MISSSPLRPEPFATVFSLTVKLLSVQVDVGSVLSTLEPNWEVFEAAHQLGCNLLL